MGTKPALGIPLLLPALLLLSGCEHCNWFGKKDPTPKPPPPNPYAVSTQVGGNPPNSPAVTNQPVNRNDRVNPNGVNPANHQNPPKDPFNTNPPSGLKMPQGPNLVPNINMSNKVPDDPFAVNPKPNSPADPRLPSRTNPPSLPVKPLNPPMEVDLRDQPTIAPKMKPGDGPPPIGPDLPLAVPPSKVPNVPNMAPPVHHDVPAPIDLLPAGPPPGNTADGPPPG